MAPLMAHQLLLMGTSTRLDFFLPPAKGQASNKLLTLFFVWV
jgi:hypothetical protein